MGIGNFFKKLFSGKKEVETQKAGIDFEIEKRKLVKDEKKMTEEELLVEEYIKTNNFHINSTIGYFVRINPEVNLDAEEMQKRADRGLRKISEQFVNKLVADYGSLKNLQGDYPDLPSDWIKDEVIFRIADYVTKQASEQNKKLNV